MKVKLSGPAELLDMLQRMIPGTSNRTLRQFLKQGRVRVNGEICKIAGRHLKTGETVEIGPTARSRTPGHGVDVVFEDDTILVIRKPAGLLTVATPHERERTVFAYLREYLRDADPRAELFIVHRLDKFVSGLLVFARSEHAARRLKDLFARHDIERRYWAIVEGKVKSDQGTVESFLVETPLQRMRSTRDETAGKRAVTHFRVLRRFSNSTALEVTLETGRKNQIRVHLSEMGHPIVGDRTYGSVVDPIGRIGLHAFLLGFRHPVTGQPVLYRTDPPEQFRRYLPVSAITSTRRIGGTLHSRGRSSS